MLELKFQSEILRSLKLQGGFGCKISDRYKRGVPDLLVATKSGLVLLELKSLKKVSEKFKVNTGVTLIQQEMLSRYNDARGEIVAAQLIYIEHCGEKRAVAWPADANIITYEYERNDKSWQTRNSKEPYWDVDKIVRSVTLMTF